MNVILIRNAFFTKSCYCCGNTCLLVSVKKSSLSKQKRFVCILSLRNRNAHFIIVDMSNRFVLCHYNLSNTYLCVPTRNIHRYSHHPIEDGEFYSLFENSLLKWMRKHCQRTGYHPLASTSIHLQFLETRSRSWFCVLLKQLPLLSVIR